jgi:hypothetical protein
VRTALILAALLVAAVLLGLGWLTDGATAAAAIGTVGLGALVGVSELVARYTDSPEDALSAWPGLLYIAVNMLAAGAAFGLAHGFNLLNFTLATSPATSQSARLLTETLVSGLGAMAFFRSSVFTVRVGGTDVAVGPASVLQVILNAVDRACDRERALPRAQFVSQLMNGVSFTKAADILPQFCFSAMQNVSVGDRQVVLDWIKLLKSDAAVDDDQKALLLGLRLLNIVGRDVLTKTVDGLGPQIRSSLQIDLETLSRLQRVDFVRDAPAVIAICYALAQGAIAVDRAALGQLVDEIGGQPVDNEVKVLLLASELLKAFGDGVVGQALKMFAPGLPPGGRAGASGAGTGGAATGGATASGATAGGAAAGGAAGGAAGSGATAGAAAGGDATVGGTDAGDETADVTTSDYTTAGGAIAGGGGSTGSNTESIPPPG